MLVQFEKEKENSCVCVTSFCVLFPIELGSEGTGRKSNFLFMGIGIWQILKKGVFLEELVW